MSSRITKNEWYVYNSEVCITLYYFDVRQAREPAPNPKQSRIFEADLPFCNSGTSTLET